MYRKKNIGLMNLVGSAMAALVFMYLLWQQFDPRVMIIFVICAAISEVFVKIRWRLSVVCRVCGFDPIMYLKNPQAAAEKVKLQLDIRKQDPKYLLSKPLNLPAIAPKKAEALAHKGKGRLISRTL